ncbi:MULTISPECIES: Ycf66 family protein [Thermoleptolyngbya]|uniref:Ycf66 family protein n=1 Tax=Thermoleptolyngbya TaxID=2303528 RepID=UPI0019651211|nr:MULTISPECIES: Ycf66 family protein [Thermoleptolyngbya]
MSHILALVVALGSFGLYMSAFFLPEVYRKNDFVWSGVGMFYALVLWVCAGRITGGVLLGQMASVALLGWMGWQLIESRRLLTPYDQQTRLPGSSRNLGDLLKLAAEELPGRLQTQFKALPQQASGWMSQVTSRVGKSPKLAGKPARSLPKASPKTVPPQPAPADASSDTPALATPAAARTRQPRPPAKTTPAAAAPSVTPTMPEESPTPSVEGAEPPDQAVSSTAPPTKSEAAPAVSDPLAPAPSTVPLTAPSTIPSTAIAASDPASDAELGRTLEQVAADETSEPAAWAELATDSTDSTNSASPDAFRPATEDSFTLDEVLVELATGEMSGEMSVNVPADRSPTDTPIPFSAAPEVRVERQPETFELEPDARTMQPSSLAPLPDSPDSGLSDPSDLSDVRANVQPDVRTDLRTDLRTDVQPENSQTENQPQPQIQDLIESADGLFELATEPESGSSRLDAPVEELPMEELPIEELLDAPRSLDVQPLPAQPEDAAWEFDWELPSLDSPGSGSPAPDLPAPDLPAPNLQDSDLQNWTDEAGAIAQNWQDEFDDDFSDDFDPEPENAGENAVIVSIERLDLSPALADPIEQRPNEAAAISHANAAETTEDLEPAKSEPSFADEDPDDDLLI